MLVERSRGKAIIIKFAFLLLLPPLLQKMAGVQPSSPHETWESAHVWIQHPVSAVHMGPRQGQSKFPSPENLLG